MPHKRIIVCCDGTWNNSDGVGQVPTNVAKLARCIDAEAEVMQGEEKVQIKQIVYYQHGIGSVAGRIFGPIENAIEGATGRGVRENIMQAYQFICLNYQHGDEIFLFGFSRGAFTARSIAHLIWTMGLLNHRGLVQLGSIFEQWERQNEKEKVQGALDDDREVKDYFRNLLHKEWTRPSIPIKVCAVWDTVGSLGLPRPFFLPQPVSKRLAFVNTKVLPHVEYAFQALALDERRRQFKPTLWEKPDGQIFPKVLKQCWFPGSHSDVGGGLKDDEAARVPLAWMLSQLDGLLNFDPLAVGQFMRGKGPSPSFIGRIHNSMRGLFLLGGSYYRVPGTFTSLDPVSREPTPNRLRNTYETIHWTARQRMSQNIDNYDKAGLVDFTMKAVMTEPDSPIVHDAENKTHLPLPQGPGRLTAVQWVSERHKVSLMEDEMRSFEQKILQLWDMQDLYAMTVDSDKKGSLETQESDDDVTEATAERVQRLSNDRKRTTVDVSANTPEDLRVSSALRRETA
ncbi:uncharacterized protein Z518_07252 [Rhinocladiella mackenziei CBS 650.93]|uniref:T6SS Phospholipase effector Tle1-like catalytic domain-containing protein n=1 Tax=Rhinocladiella mackenziei CBS 650.93 TaxID=1442369 RepID=A0A0D2ICX0_9EURO|nr:uncharacterized protein Z518_07252 [Rhinocladiella mackenziei CBS 650.93]KIX03699.1 hypothetical protein Z518_07252 [Rhinocladiella mackenziei CBS 650.93]